jgi:hypothetical protein
MLERMHKALVGFVLCFGIASMQGCSLVDTYYTYDDAALKQMSDELVTAEPGVFKDKRPMKVLGTLGHFLEATKIRVKIESAGKTTLKVYKTYTLTDELKKVIGDTKVNLNSEIIDYPDCSYFDERNWSCEDLFRSKYEMKDGQLHVGGIKLKKNYTLKM